jgi:hypothetical protein
MNLLSVGNPKTIKGEAKGYLTFILHLAPASESGYNVCPMATDGCKAGCLNKAGRGGMFAKGTNTNVIQQARIRKTRLFFEDRTSFMAQLVKDIQLGIKQAAKANLIPVFRLNGTSDLSWEKYSAVLDGVQYANVFEAFPTIQFYDYTKVPGRKVAAIQNYKLTFSAADGNQDNVVRAISKGTNVSVVFTTRKGKDLPAVYMNRPVIDGDDSDLRFLDPQGVIVGLRMKGNNAMKAGMVRSGFAVQV